MYASVMARIRAHHVSSSSELPAYIIKTCRRSCQEP
jgi:hypothetical protein